MGKITTKVAAAAAAAAATTTTIICEQHPSSKRQKIGSKYEVHKELGSHTNVNAENIVAVCKDDSKDGFKMLMHNTFEDFNKQPCTLDDKRVSSTTRRPKVSIGSTSNDVCSSESDEESEMDIMIAQESIWSTRKKCEGTANEDNGMDRHNENEDDHSDIVCLGTSSESQMIDEMPPSRARKGKVDECRDSVVYARGDDHDNGANPEIGCVGTITRHESPHKSHCQEYDIVEELSNSGGIVPVSSEDNIIRNKGDSCASDSLIFIDHETDPDDSNTNPQPKQLNSPKKDVCYICGSDLSLIRSGLRGRVAHMKRCSAKYGNVLGGRKSMNNDGDFDADFVETGAEDVSSGPTPKKVSGVFNPYDKNQWHGDASSELELNKPMSPSSNSSSKDTQPKQTMLKNFFKAPVRSLANVLMAGARQAAKGKAITNSAALPASKSGKKRGHWSSKRSGNCPAFKRITGTDFICDGFQYARRSLSENYFLTHFHSDHYGGISKTWSDGAIYCSLPTANLVHQQLGVDKRYLHPIPINTPTVIASKGKPVTVTLLNANHCPGAIMFLFEVGNKNILHVGDFRWQRELMLKEPQLKAFSNSCPRLDELYFDTTYCNKKYTLPTQEEAISAAIEVAEKEMSISKKDKKNKTLFLFGAYTIGKEKIYLSVAEHLRMKVYVDSRRYRILSSLEWPKERMNIFTTDKSETSLWVVPLGSVNMKQMRDHLDEGNKNKVFTAPYGRVVGFRPTGWTYSAQDTKQRTLPGPKPVSNLISSKTSGRYSIHGVPYSEHSSFPELVDCLKVLKPRKITPTVSVSKSEEQLELLLNAL